MQEIKQIINHLKDRAVKSMRHNGGELEPKLYFLILYSGQKTPVYFPVPCSLFFENNMLKSKMHTYVQFAWDKKKANSPAGIELKAVCLISDTWFVQRPMPPNLTKDEALDYAIKESEHLVPSEDPKRYEGLSLNINLPAESYSVIIRYTRKGKNILFDDPRNAEGLGGRMLELFPVNP